MCMDEPTMGLSPLYVDRVLELIAAINRQGVTIFMVEQNANLALQIAHEAYVLQTGRIVLHGPAEALRAIRASATPISAARSRLEVLALASLPAGALQPFAAAVGSPSDSISRLAQLKKAAPWITSAIARSSRADRAQAFDLGAGRTPAASR